MARLFNLNAARLGDAPLACRREERPSRPQARRRHLARLLRGHHHARRRVHPRRVHQADAGDRRKLVRGELETAAAITYRLAQYLAPQAQE